MYINPALGTHNKEGEAMMRKGRIVVVEHICESAQAVTSVFSHLLQYSM